jgi:hypothetical protein
MIHAVSPAGKGLWFSQVETPLFYHTPQISAEGNYIFFRGEAYDATSGEALDFSLDFQVDEFFSGQDDRNYLRTGGTVVAWESEGTGITLAEERVLSTQGLPDSVGVSSQELVWLRYDNEFLWFTKQGEALGVSTTNRRFFDHYISIDAESRIYTCGEHARPTCYALSLGSVGPLWEVALGDDFEKIAGSAYMQGKIFIATEEGHLYVLGGVK